MTRRTPIRVVQWTTGNVGKESGFRAGAPNRSSELIGCYAWSPDKVGVDAGVLCGGATPLGVLATNDVDALLALQPGRSWSTTRCRPVVEEMVGLPLRPMNMARTAAFVTGHGLGAAASKQLDEACQRGGASTSARA